MGLWVSVWPVAAGAGRLVVVSWWAWGVLVAGVVAVGGGAIAAVAGGDGMSSVVVRRGSRRGGVGGPRDRGLGPATQGAAGRGRGEEACHGRCQWLVTGDLRIGEVGPDERDDPVGLIGRCRAFAHQGLSQLRQDVR
jgi:hypothetical protein